LHDIDVLIVLESSLPLKGIGDALQICLHSSQPGSLDILSRKQHSHIRLEPCHKCE
jgi:hypothetical protein